MKDCINKMDGHKECEDHCMWCKSVEPKPEEEHIREAYEEMAKLEMEIYESNQKTLSEVPDELRSDIKDLMSDVNVDVEMEFVDSPKGDYQTEGLSAVKGTWVDQWRNGGYTGDDFAGNMYVKIEENKYLKIPYWC